MLFIYLVPFLGTSASPLDRSGAVPEAEGPSPASALTSYYTFKGLEFLEPILSGWESNRGGEELFWYKNEKEGLRSILSPPPPPPPLPLLTRLLAFYKGPSEEEDQSLPVIWPWLPSDPLNDAFRIYFRCTTAATGLYCANGQLSVSTCSERELKLHYLLCVTTAPQTFALKD